MQYAILLILTTLLFPPAAYAQIKIGKFYASGKPDWVEIVNEADSEVSFSGYLITDIAGNKIQKNIYIPAKGNCIFDWNNKLNNKGDVIFLKKGEVVLECVKYGDGAGGECEIIREPVSDKPESNCFEATPTPKPTVVLTPPPTPIKTTAPEPSPEVLAKETDKQSVQSVIPAKAGIQSPEASIEPDATPSQTEIPDRPRDNLVKIFALLTGLSLIVGAAAYIAWKEYNERHRSI